MLCNLKRTGVTDLDGSADDHDGVVQRSLRLLGELLGSAPQDDGARLRLGAAFKQVVPAREKKRQEGNSLDRRQTQEGS